MTDNPDWLRHAFQTIARDDAKDAERSAARIAARLTDEWRANRRTPARGPAAKAVGLAIAATLLAGLGVPVWLVTRGPRSIGSTTHALQAAPVEIRTAFLPLAYHDVPYTDGHLVRLEVPRTALAAFGLTPAD